jgi:hypothetical protein
MSRTSRKVTRHSRRAMENRYPMGEQTTNIRMGLHRSSFSRQLSFERAVARCLKFRIGYLHVSAFSAKF